MSPNKNKPRDPERLMHLVEAAEWVVSEVIGITLADLMQDRKLQLSLERQFEIIGEAAAHVSGVTQQQWPQIPWQKMKAYRNFIAHEYFRADYAQLLFTAQQLLPPTLPDLRQLLADLDRQFGPDANV